MAFLFWLGIRGARSAVVRPNAFLRRKSAAFSACNAENIRKCNRHGASEACGVSRLSFHFLFSKNDRIFAVMRPDPDLTQTGAKTQWIYWDLFDKMARLSLLSRIFWTFERQLQLAAAAKTFKNILFYIVLKERNEMNTLFFIVSCLAGCFCFWLFFVCINWFEDI